MQDSGNGILRDFNIAQKALEAGDLEKAEKLFESLDYDRLKSEEPDDALAARVLALQLAVLQERFNDALYHADSALDIAEYEPLIHHLAGQALWKQGHQRSAAEMLVYAAELLDGTHDGVPQPNFPVDRAQVFYMAAEACREYEQESAAEHFYKLALENMKQVTPVAS